MTTEIQQLTKEENTLIALLKFWGSTGFKHTKKLDSNIAKNLDPSEIRARILNICAIDINSGDELSKASNEFANYINRDFLNQTFNNFKTSNNQNTRIFLKVVPAKFNRKNKIRPNTYMSFWEKRATEYDNIIENPMPFAGPGTGSLVGRDFGYIVIKVFDDFPVLETRTCCDRNEILISSNDLLNCNCDISFIPKILESEYDIQDQSTIFKKVLSKFRSIFG